MAAKKTGKGANNPVVEKVTGKLESGASSTPASDKERLETAAAGGGAPAAPGATVNITTPDVDPEPTPPSVDSSSEETDQPDDTPDPTQPPGPDDVPPGLLDLKNRIGNAQAAPPAETRAQARDRIAMERQSRNTQSPSTKKLGPLGEKVPGAEHLKIHLREANGEKTLIGIYNINDFSANQNVETFIYQHIKPTTGPGVFDVTLVDAFGREYDAGSVRIKDPINPTTAERVAPGTNPMDLVNNLVAQQQQQLQDALNRMRSTPEKDPVVMLKNVLDLQKEVTGGQDEEAKGTLAAMIQSQAQQTQAFMSMLVNLQAKSDDRMATMMAASKGTDPVMLALLTSLLEDKKSGGGDKMPPMPPVPDPVQNLKTLAEVVALLRPEKSDGDNKLVEMLLGERMSPKDMLEFVKGGQGTDDFKKAFENWQVMMSAVQSLRQSTEPGGSSGFWEFASALVTNQDFAGSIANVIRNKTLPAGGGQRVVLPPGVTPQQLAAHTDAGAEAEIIDFERRAAGVRTRRLELARRRIDAERQLQQESEALQQEIDRNPNAHKPVVDNPSPTPPAPPVQGAAPQPPVATEEQAQAVQRAVERTGGKFPPLPPEIVEHLNNIIGAPDDGDLVEGMFRLLFYLARIEEYRQFAQAVFVCIQRNDKQKVIEFLDSFFKGLEDINLTDKSLRDRVLLVFDRHFEDIVQHAQAMRQRMEEESESGEDDDEEEEDAGDDDGFPEDEEGEDTLNTPPTGA